MGWPNSTRSGALIPGGQQKILEGMIEVAYLHLYCNTTPVLFGFFAGFIQAKAAYYIKKTPETASKVMVGANCKLRCSSHYRFRGAEIGLTISDESGFKTKSMVWLRSLVPRWNAPGDG
jgi:hypothetical protein